MRLIHLKTISTRDRPSQAVRDGNGQIQRSGTTPLLYLRYPSLETAVEDPATPIHEVKKLAHKMSDIETVLELIETPDVDRNARHLELTWIVTRKPVAMAQKGEQIGTNSRSALIFSSS